jgi:glutamyl-Q tRNA(Asp) synthetase
MTALASYLQAKSQNGYWLLRMDDLDTARNHPGADTQILRQLEQHGLFWDESPRYQAQHVAEYAAAVDQLRKSGRLFSCACTRAELQSSNLTGIDGPIYSGTCRYKNLGQGQNALRLTVSDQTLSLDDGWQGRQHRKLLNDVGDFVVLRRDGQVSYQLACAVDEAAQRIVEVVRGADLLASTFRQIHLQAILNLPTSLYRHLPVLLDGRGRKLSKQNGARPILAQAASQNLWRCLQLLGQTPPAELAREPPKVILQWATIHWSPEIVPRLRSLHWE